MCTVGMGGWLRLGGNAHQHQMCPWFLPFPSSLCMRTDTLQVTQRDALPQLAPALYDYGAL